MSKNNYWTSKALLTTTALVFLAAFGYSSYKIYLWYRDSHVAINIMSELDSPTNAPDFNNLIIRNPDTVAWVTVPGTEINYPVVQTEDNDYYLFHSFDKKPNQAGWIFADYRNNFEELDKNTIIYGHGFINKIMFGTLKDTLKAEWRSVEDNRIITLVTPEKKLTWQVFSIYRLKTSDDYLSVSFNNEAEFTKFLGLIKGRSSYDFGIDIGADDKVLTLSTCYNQAEKVVLHAKLINSHNY